MGNILSFTGPRPQKLGGFEGEKALAIQIPLYKKLHEIVFRAWKSGGFDTFISGGALGVDQMAMEAVIHHKKQLPNIKLIVARPFPSQASKWPKTAQEKYKRMCAFADEIIDVNSDPYSVEKMHTRNKWMVDKCHALVACWADGGYGGGTYQCLEYARNLKPILIVNPYTLTERWKIQNRRW